MYLTARKYVKNWDHLNLEEKYTVNVTKGGKPFETEMKVKEILYEAAYWRKANQIHQWFVSNVQNNMDNCQEVYVSKEQLQQLLDLCKEVKAKAVMKKAKVHNGTSSYTNEQNERVTEEIMEDGEVIQNDEEIANILPTTDGFFFGSTDYNEYYMHDIDITIEQLEKVLASPSDFDFYYEASW